MPAWTICSTSKALERAHQAARAFDVHRLVERAFLSTEVEKGDKVDEAGDVRTVRLTEAPHRLLDRGVLCEVDLDQREVGLSTFLVEPDDRIGVRQGRGKRAADVSSRTGDENNRLPGFGHSSATSPATRVGFGPPRIERLHADRNKAGFASVPVSGWGVHRPPRSSVRFQKTVSKSRKRKSGPTASVQPAQDP